MGVTEATLEVAGNPFLKGGQIPYITIDPTTKQIKILPGVELNVFMTTLGLKNDDKILAVNGTNYNLDNIYDLVLGSMNWKDGDDITMKINRDGKDMDIKGKVVMPKEKTEGYKATDASKKALLEAWLKG